MLVDFAFDFRALARDVDGDETGEADFSVGVDGAGDSYTGLGELDPEVETTPTAETETLDIFMVPF